MHSWIQEWLFFFVKKRRRMGIADNTGGKIPIPVSDDPAIRDIRAVPKGFPNRLVIMRMKHKKFFQKKKGAEVFLRPLFCL